MSRKYRFMYFKHDSLCVKVVYLRKPIQLSRLPLALAGFVQCKALGGRISLVIDYRERSLLSYDFACAAVGSDGQIRILMEPEVYLDFLRGKPYSRTAIMHEMGHIYHKDLEDPKFSTDKYDEERLSVLQSGGVDERELQADAFAAMLLGQEAICVGLKDLQKMATAKNDPDYEETIEELTRRISILEKKNEG